MNDVIKVIMQIAKIVEMYLEKQTLEKQTKDEKQSEQHSTGK